MIKVPKFKDKSDRTITICYQKKTILIVFKMNGKRGDAIERRGGGLIIRELVMRRRRGDGQKGW